MLAGFKEGGRVEIREEATGQAKHVYQFSSDGVSVNGAFRPASAGRARVPADDVAESGAGLLWREALLHEPAASDGRRQEAFIAASVAWRRNTAAPQRDDGQSRRIDLHEVFVGVVLGGAIGDALGAPVEFLSTEEIRRRYGSKGLQDLQATPSANGSSVALYTDDTQLAEVVLRSALDSLNAGEGLDEAMRRMSRRFVEWMEHPLGGHRVPGTISARHRPRR